MKRVDRETLAKLWRRIQRKKYAYGFGRGFEFINRCDSMQHRIVMIEYGHEEYWKNGR